MQTPDQTSAARKFTFDTVFEGDRVIAAAPRPKRSYSAEEVEAIRAERFAEGERSAVAKAQEAQAEAMRALSAALSTLTTIAHEHRTGAARLALAAADKIADAALTAFPQAPLTAAIDALAREIDAVPRLVARIADDQVDAAQAALTEAAAAAGYPGQIVVRADSALKGAAFVLDWGDGSAAFDPAQAAARVAQALETALASEGLHAEPLLPASPHPPSEA
jgi:flagellar assembly protein FliH